MPPQTAPPGTHGPHPPQHGPQGHAPHASGNKDDGWHCLNGVYIGRQLNAKQLTVELSKSTLLVSSAGGSVGMGSHVASLSLDMLGANIAQRLNKQQQEPQGPHGPPGLGGQGPQGPPGDTGPPGTQVPVTWYGPQNQKP
ncbi:hypothetical protein HW555_014226 [Spodoptera exigua]|uniref:Uncharacterized protein n=1 Tax=Spodoptera exigua TaxID=7107 RepID=A0A835KXD8_SPOEX|nr:hypothetical protein HW555_014226 [Spodoptera exigua]